MLVTSAGFSPIKKTLSYNYALTGVPTGTVNVALTAGAGGATINSNALREAASATTNGYYWCAAVMPDPVGTSQFSCTVTNAAQSNSLRGIGPGCFSVDGTLGVFAIMSGNTLAAGIYSWAAGTLTPQSTLSASYSTSSSDQITIEPSVSSGVVTWVVLKNGTPTGLSWPDSGHVVDLPGNHPAACFRHQYAGGQFYSPGISALAAADL